MKSEGVDRTLEMLLEVNAGLIFTNLVDFDMKYGHSRDITGSNRRKGQLYICFESCGTMAWNLRDRRKI